MRGKARKAFFMEVRAHVEFEMGDGVEKEEMREGFKYAERRQCLRQGMRRMNGVAGDRDDAEAKFKRQATIGYVHALTGEVWYDSEDEELDKHFGAQRTGTR